MKRRHILISVAAMVVLLLIVRLWPRTNSDGQRQVMIGSIISGLKTPITFYGKALDQHGDPVPYARVGYRLLDKFMASGTQGSAEADENGNIFLTNLKGIEISVGIDKEGYYCIQDISSQSYAFGKNTDSYTKMAPTKENPAVLLLQKMGKTVPLYYLTRRCLLTPANGKGASINLATGKPNKYGLQIISTIQKNNGMEHLDWQYELKIEGGGLIERKEPYVFSHTPNHDVFIEGKPERNKQYDFAAPEVGYESSLKVGRLADEPKWMNSKDKSYYAKFHTGQYAFIKISFIAREDGGFIVIESYLNPTPGDRNLEPDPKKRIKIE